MSHLDLPITWTQAGHSWPDLTNSATYSNIFQEKLDLAAKAEEERAVDRLHKVGAKIVVLPQVVGGKQLANAFLEMEKVEKLETVSKKK